MPSDPIRQQVRNELFTEMREQVAGALEHILFPMQPACWEEQQKTESFCAEAADAAIEAILSFLQAAELPFEAIATASRDLALALAVAKKDMRLFPQESIE